MMQYSLITSITSSVAIEQAYLILACHLVAKEGIHFVKKRGIVVTMVHNPYTGPWEIIGKEFGSSYKLQLTINKRINKGHASQYLPIPYSNLAL